MSQGIRHALRNEENHCRWIWPYYTVFCYLFPNNTWRKTTYAMKWWSHIMEMTKSFAWLFLLCPLSFFKPMSIRELRRSPAVSSTWSLVVNIYLMGRHVSCMLDQSVTLIRSFSSPVWTFSTFSSFIKTYYLVLLKLALVCACMTISIAGQKGH